MHIERGKKMRNISTTMAIMAIILLSASVLGCTGVTTTQSQAPVTPAVPATPTTTLVPSAPWSVMSYGNYEKRASGGIVSYPYYPSSINVSSIVPIKFHEDMLYGAVYSAGQNNMAVREVDFEFKFSLMDGSTHTSNVTIGADDYSGDTSIHYMDMDGDGVFSI